MRFCTTRKIYIHTILEPNFYIISKYVNVTGSRIVPDDRRQRERLAGLPRDARWAQSARGVSDIRKYITWVY